MIRLVLAILLLLIALLAVLRAPAYPLWLLAILVTEFPAVGVVLSLGFIALGIRAEKYVLAGILIPSAALLLFLSPVVRSWRLSKGLSRELSALWGEPHTAELIPFRWLSLVAGDREQAPTRSTRTYVRYAEISLDLDVYSGPQAQKLPCVLVVHGGSWSSGDSKQLPELNDRLAAEGYRVAALNYRMAPGYKNPAPVQDVAAALQYLREHAEELAIDTTRFFLLGRSAGAQIALLAAYTLDDPSIRGVVDFYGPADMVWGYSVPSNPLIMNSRRVMENYLGGTYAAVPEHYLASSPLAAIHQKTVPTLIIHGENDVLVAYEHSIRLERRLRETGTEHYSLRLPWATHGFDYTLNGPGGQLSTYTVLRFLQHFSSPI